MGLVFTDNGVKKVCTLVLVGTIAGSITCGPVTALELENVKNDNGYYNEVLNGYYYDEDVKKSKSELMFNITSRGKSKVKSYSKKQSVVSRTIIK